MQAGAGSGFAADETLLIGLGGHKCGSSWLAGYLRGHPDCFVPSQKELDVFGSRHIKHHNWRIRHRMQKIRDLLNHFRKNVLRGEENVGIDDVPALDQLNAEIFDLTQNMAVLTGHAPYADCFRRKVGESVLVDISPYYSIVDEDVYADMNAQHDRVKFLFSLRDPAERFFSAYRYGKSLNNNPLPTDTDERLAELQARVDDHFLGGTTDYARTLNALDEVIEPEQLLVLFYEDLFHDEAMQRLCAFLGIEFRSGNYERKIHETMNDGEVVNISSKEREFLVDCFYHVYKEIDDRFGSRAPDAWNWPDDIAKSRQARAENEGMK